MYTIALITQKGGAGKSTICQELSVCAETEGSKVAIIDFDRQQSITQWGKDREAETPVIIPVSDKSLEDFIRLAENKGYDYLFIDTGGKDDPTVYEGMQHADLCLVPTRARKKDIFPARVNIEASTKLGKDLVFVLNHTPARLRADLMERAKALSSYGVLCPVRIGNRVDFQDADDNGLSVLEMNPNSKASLEVQELWSWIKKHIKKSNPTL